MTCNELRRPQMTDDAKKRGDDELEALEEDGVDYTDTKAKQDEFEQLAREEGFDKAAKKAARGKKPSKRPPTSTQPPQ
jgi:hypothetical protein